MVIEYLSFEVAPADREQWLHVEEATWSRFLEAQPGFIRKQLWTERGDDHHVHAVIEWADEASWFAIPHEQLQAVDEAMGPWRREGSLRVFDVLRDC